MADDKHIVEAHEQIEDDRVVEIIPEHIDRKEASQTEFDHSKKFLTKVFGGKRCPICELRGEVPTDHHPENHIESHHVIEWCHWNDLTKKADGTVDFTQVEIYLRAKSPLIHGLLMMSHDDILAGKPLPSLWDHPDLKGKPLNSLDDPRNQWFLCHAHHQQTSNKEIQDGFDVVGLHHEPYPLFCAEAVLPKGKHASRHVDPHADKLNRKV